MNKFIAGLVVGTVAGVLLEVTTLVVAEELGWIKIVNLGELYQQEKEPRINSFGRKYSTPERR